MINPTTIIDSDPLPVIPEQSEQVKAVIDQLVLCKRELEKIPVRWYNMPVVIENLKFRDALIQQLFALL